MSSGVQAATTFAAVGDYGSAGYSVQNHVAVPNNNKSAEDVAAFLRAKAPKFVLSLGDQIYPPWEQSDETKPAGSTFAEGIHRYDLAVGKLYKDFIPITATDSAYFGQGSATMNFYPTLGDHDWWKQRDRVDCNPACSGGKVYLDNASDFYGTYFAGLLGRSNTGSVASTAPRRWYDGIEDSVHFYSLSSDPNEYALYTNGYGGGLTSLSSAATNRTSPEGQWLQASLAASNQPWNIVFMHEAPYGSDTHGGHPPSPYMDLPYTAWGADLVLVGHVHAYERLNVTDATNGNTALPVIVDGAGGTFESFAEDSATGSTPVVISPYSQLYIENVYGYQLFTATAMTLRSQFFGCIPQDASNTSCNGDVLLDDFMLLKNGTISDKSTLDSLQGLQLTAVSGGAGSMNTITTSGFDATLGRIAATDYALSCANYAKTDPCKTAWGATTWGITGPGGLVKTGSGTLSLVGTNTYTGGTIVSAGTLSVDGSIATSAGVVVTSGATLGGTGTVAATTISSGGTLAPGHSIGTLAMSGNLTLAAGSIFKAEVSPTQSDRVNVTGNAAVSGTATFVPAVGTYTVNNRYPLISTTGAVTGQFAATDFGAGFGAKIKPKVVYTSNSVLLALNPASLTAFLPTTLSDNHRSVAAVIDAAFAAGTAPQRFMDIASLSPTAAADALSQLTGEIGAAAQHAEFSSLNAFQTTVLDPYLQGRGDTNTARASLAFAPLSDTPSRLGAFSRAHTIAGAASAYGEYGNRAGALTVWGSAFGGHDVFQGSSLGGTRKYSSNLSGFAGGVDVRVASNALLGGAGGMTQTNWKVANGTGKTRSTHGGVFTSIAVGQTYFALSAVYGRYHVSTFRSISVGGAERYGADFKANSYGGHIEIGHRLTQGSFTFTPFAALDLAQLDIPAYSETVITGTGVFALSYTKQAITDFNILVGFRFGQRLVDFSDGGISLRGDLAWKHNYSPVTVATAGFQSIAGSTFASNAAELPSEAALSSLGLEFDIGSSASLDMKATGQFGGRQLNSYGGTAAIRLVW